MRYDELELPWRRVFELEWKSTLAGSMAIAAVIVSAEGEIISEGRNRVAKHFYLNFQEPPIHKKDLNDLDVKSDISLSRRDINIYFSSVKEKIEEYISELTDEQLLEFPPNCEYSRFTLILAQFRHLHTHMGMLMGFVIDDTGLWPRVLGLEKPFPEGDYEKYF